MRLKTIILTLMLLALLPAATAGASARQVTVMQDDGQLFRSGDAAREKALGEMRALGADVIKVQVYWREIAPSGRRKPAGFAATDPASYDWSTYDPLVKSIVAHGMRPFLSIGQRAPDWAIRKRTRAHPGSYWPSAKEFGLFARAAGKRYSGDYQGLPRVDLWSIWNEPNLKSWLAPQRSSKGVPLAPSIYRGLYLAGHRGLSATGHAADTILIGELMPLGAGSASKFSPAEFLREMACVNSRYRPYRGRAAKARRCGRVRRIPTSGIAQHPYTPRGGLTARPKAGESPIQRLGALTSVLDRLAARGKLPRHLPVWLTEFGFQTNPPDPYQYPLKKVAAMLDQSEWFAFRNPRVRSVSQYTLRDEGLNPGGGFQRYATFQMGVRFAGGRAKRYVYDAFRMPAFVHRVSARRVEVFGGLRPLTGGTAQIESARPGGRYRALGAARLNRAGYFRRIFTVAAASTRSYRITIDGRSRVKSVSR